MACWFLRGYRFELQVFVIILPPMAKASKSWNGLLCFSGCASPISKRAAEDVLEIATKRGVTGVASEGRTGGAD